MADAAPFGGDLHSAADGRRDGLVDHGRRAAMRGGAAAFALVHLPACHLSANAVTGLTLDEQRTLDAFADMLVPGAAHARTALFVDTMLRQSDRMLAYQLAGSIVPAQAFYPEALAALQRLSRAIAGVAIEQLPANDGERLVGALLAPRSAWTGPPAFLTYWAIRNDALDATYADEASYDALNIPYLAHIQPPARW